MRGLRIAAWVVAALTLALVTVHVVQVARGATRIDMPLWAEPLLVLTIGAPVAVGLMIASSRPRNVVAWIMLLAPPLLTIPAAVELFGSTGWALQLDRSLWPVLYVWPIAVAYVFPDGRLLSPRWRWVVFPMLASVAGAIAIMALDPGPFHTPNESVPNPVGGNRFGDQLAPALIPLLLGMLAGIVGGAIAVRTRLRRSKGMERLQTLWFAWAVSLIPIGLALCVVSSLVFGDFVLDWILFVFVVTMPAVVAASIGVAVARYHLFAIERMVNRTLVYAALTTLLAGIYAAVAIGLGVEAGRSSEWVTAAATLAVALAFAPLRKVVQDGVDRRFSRARYEAVRRVRTFEQQVRENRRAPEEIGGVLARALDDASAELLFWLPASKAYANAAGDLVVELRTRARAQTAIDSDGARTALLLHDPALLERRDLLDAVLAAAALSIEIARLRVEVRLQVAEVHASRARIVEAGYEERRRLERDLHDGAQQRLVSLGIRLRRIQRSLPRGAGVLAPAFDQIVDEVGAAVADLRQIAAGVRPARLDDGLAAALADLARSAPLPVEVEAPSERAPASIEAAAYFVACEALTNAVKHASPSKVALRAVRDNSTLLVTISDDGVGGAVARRGSGLAGLRDRVAAHGGTITITSPPGGGTLVEAALPCEA